jgi:small conductance mechanosensitive channel
MLENITTWLESPEHGRITRIMVAFCIILFTFFINSVFRRVFNRVIKRYSDDINNTPNNYRFIRYFVSALIFLIGFGFAIYTIPSLRTITHSMFAGAGLIAVAVGFASQEALSNIVGGIFIVAFKPFRVTDRITVKDTVSGLSGIVEDITLRHTVIRGFDNNRIIIPNSVMSREVLINNDIIDEKVCKMFEVGIAYESNIDLARKLIQEEAMKHPMSIDNRSEMDIERGVDQVMVRVVNWADSAVILKVWVWAVDGPGAFQMGCDLLESIIKRFKEAGIEIPYPHRKLIIEQPITINDAKVEKQN